MTITEQIRIANRLHTPRVMALVAEIVGQEGLLAEMTHYHLGTGGKRLRAVLPVLLAEALGAETKQVYPLAAACEMIHNATLVHDDLQDGDDQRRGHPTVWRRYGTAHAINLGDAMYFFGLRALDRLEGPPELRWQLAHEILVGATRVMAGQVLESQLKELSRPTLDQYFEMVEHKTSALFALPLAGAARVAGAGPEFIAAVTAAARHLGIIFQVQDDLLDLWGDKGRATPGSDIAEGKVSGLVVHALNQADAPTAAQLRRTLALPREETRPEVIVETIDQLEALGSKAFGLAEINRRQAAIEALPELHREPAARVLLTGLTEAFLEPIAHLLTE